MPKAKQNANKKQISDFNIPTWNHVIAYCLPTSIIVDVYIMIKNRNMYIYHTSTLWDVICSAVELFELRKTKKSRIKTYARKDLYRTISLQPWRLQICMPSGTSWGNIVPGSLTMF